MGPIRKLFPTGNWPHPFLQPTQHNSGRSRTCFRRSQIEGPERSLETTDSEKGAGKRGSPAHPVLGSVWEGMGLALLAAAQFPRILSAENSHRPRVLQGPASPQTGGPRGPLACPVTREGGASRGRLLGCGSRGSAVGGAQRAREERGGWAAGDGRKEGRTPVAATAAAAVRPGQAGTSARRARGPHSPAQPCECHRRFPGPRAVPEMGAALRVPPHSPGSAAPAAALPHIAPSPGPEPRGVVPPLPPDAEDAHKSRRLWAFFPPKARPRRPLPRSSGVGRA